MKGPLPNEVEYLAMQKRIELSTKRGDAIPTIVQFGGSKTAKHCPYPEPDIAEFMALEQLALINNKIRSIYSAGLQIKFIIADSYYSFVFGYDSGVEPYCQGMERLINDLGLIFITPVRMSTLVNEYSEEKVMTRCKENVRIIKEYWEAENKESYQCLGDAGWKGSLPQRQKEYYMKRAARILSKKEMNTSRIKEEKKSATIRFLAYALMLAQFDLVGRTPMHIIDVSFVPLAPGEPKELYNRFRIAPAPPGGTRRSAPPWSVQGILTWPNLKPTIYTYLDVESDKYAFKRKHTLQVGSCTIRADLYEKKSSPK